MDAFVAGLLLFLFYFGIGLSWICMWKDEFNSIKTKHYRAPLRMVVFTFWPLFVALWIALVILSLFVIGAAAVWEALFE